MKEGITIKMHPGEMVAELLEESLAVEDIQAFLSGNEDVNEDIAANLEGMFGTSQDYWMHMQKNFNKSE